MHSVHGTHDILDYRESAKCGLHCFHMYAIIIVTFQLSSSCSVTHTFSKYCFSLEEVTVFPKQILRVSTCRVFFLSCCLVLFNIYHLTQTEQVTCSMSTVYNFQTICSLVVAPLTKFCADDGSLLCNACKRVCWASTAYLGRITTAVSQKGVPLSISMPAQSKQLGQCIRKDALHAELYKGCTK